MDDVAFTPALELAEAVRRRRISPVEIADALLARIDALNPALNAFVHCDPDAVRGRARALESAVLRGETLGPLHGVPWSAKDLTAVAGMPQTFGLPLLKDHVPAASAAVVRRLEAAGGLLLGKTNSPAFGYYGVTENRLFGATQNPWRPGFIAGGSSGGAAAAVAAGLGPLADGTDGAGSVRIPASCCGVFGLKPSLGRIPHSAFESRFLTFVGHGPISRSVADAALMLSVTEGPDPSDPLSLPGSGGDYLAEIRKDVRGWRVAWSPDLGFGRVDAEVAGICRDAVRAFEDLGCAVEESHPGWDDPEPAMWTLWAASFATGIDLLADEGVRRQVDENLVAVVEAGARLSGAEIARADVFRGRMWDRFVAWFADFDLLVCPTLCVEPFENGRFAPAQLDGEPLPRRLLGWLLTYPFNLLAATPAASVPCGFTRAGLPVGLQIAGGPHADAAVLRAAAAFERARPWTQRRPDL